jgi:hypothetical protein
VRVLGRTAPERRLGKPLEGRRLRHEYLYLGYDVEPDCTEADTPP